MAWIVENEWINFAWMCSEGILIADVDGLRSSRRHKSRLSRYSCSTLYRPYALKCHKYRIVERLQVTN